MAVMKHLVIDPTDTKPPTRDLPADKHIAKHLPKAKETKMHPSNAGGENAKIFFVGTATTLLEWEGVRMMTDPNFLHAGDHVHLGPGVTVLSKRVTNPAVDLHDLPRVDFVLLSHYHADHFDQDVERSLRRDLPIISTPHAKSHLAHKSGHGEAFTSVHDLDFFDSITVHIVPGSKGDPLRVEDARTGEEKVPAFKITGMPGKHVPPGGLLEAVNDFLKAVPPTNGWMIELGYTTQSAQSAQSGSREDNFECGYRIYISGDTLLVDELKEIPKRYAGKHIDLMLIHLGGTTVPGPHMPLLMLTMDAKMGVELVRMINPELTLPIHYDDYDVFLSPLSDFKKAMDEAGFGDKVVYLDRGDEFEFKVKGGSGGTK